MESRKSLGSEHGHDMEHPVRNGRHIKESDGSDHGSDGNLYEETAPSIFPPKKPRKNRSKLFGMQGQHRRQRHTTYINPDDYEQKYPEDPYGLEAGPNARIWRVYLDECEAYDKEKVEDWRDTIDVLMVFVSIFLSSYYNYADAHHRPVCSRPS